MNRFEHLTNDELAVLAQNFADARDEQLRRGQLTGMPPSALLLAALRAGFVKDEYSFNGCEGEAWAAAIGEGYAVLDITPDSITLEVGNQYGTDDTVLYRVTLEVL